MNKSLPILFAFLLLALPAVSQDVHEDSSVTGRGLSLSELAEQSSVIFIGRLTAITCSGNTVRSIFHVIEILKEEENSRGWKDQTVVEASSKENASPNDITPTVVVSYPLSASPHYLESCKGKVGKTFIVFLEPYPGKNKDWYIFRRNPSVAMIESNHQIISEIKSILLSELHNVEGAEKDKK